MKYNIIKELSKSQSQTLSNRHQVKAFNESEKMRAFLNKADNACHWEELDEQLKSGIYFQQYDSKKREMIYINVKQLFN